MGAELRKVHDGIRDLLEDARDGVVEADPDVLDGALLVARGRAWAEVPDAGGAPDERLARGGGPRDR